MHELGITRSVVAICAERAGSGKVSRVKLEVGQLTAVMPDALRFCFDICAQGTPLEGAALEIDEVPGVASCRDCGAHVRLAAPYGACGECGSRHLKLLSGEELNIKEMEVL